MDSKELKERIAIGLPVWLVANPLLQPHVEGGRWGRRVCSSRVRRPNLSQRSHPARLPYNWTTATGEILSHPATSFSPEDDKFPHAMPLYQLHAHAMD
jgi:hypothetical protein